ncbi:MAG: hypothetical protein H6736_01985 [Alphaproteobacteria bacterium]|nr:hypothetical protein [Alphaproteobacteria bacterium]
MLTALLLLACSTHKNELVVRGAMARVDDLAVAAPVFLEDHVDGDPFRRNAAVGNITFGGGYVTIDEGRGQHNVSKDVVVSEEERYQRQVTDWLADLLPLGAPVEAPVPPEAREVRGTTSRDGHDNASLPNVELRPVAMGPLPRPTLVPWVVGYYSHNAGWFYGQRWGTGAGARVHVLLVQHGEDGSVLGYMDVDGSRVSERVFSPTEAELQDLLLALEKRLGRRIGKAAPR